MFETDIDYRDVGADLVRESQEWEKSPSEVVGELFGYIFEASRRMSTRAISAWLKEKHGVEISQSSISRALRNPEKYWELFAESIEPTARIAADALDMHLKEVVFNKDVFERLCYEFEQRPSLAGITNEECYEDFNRSMDAIRALRTGWFVLSPQTRSLCYKYLAEADEADAE